MRFSIHFVNIFIFIAIVLISDNYKNKIGTHKIPFEYLLGISVFIRIKEVHKTGSQHKMSFCNQ